MKITIEQTKELERLRDEIPDPICCKKCKEFKTEKNVDHFEEMYEKSLNGTEDFTKENGATLILPGSHKTEKIPSLKLFHKNCLEVICNAGDAIFFDGRLVHRAGENKTSKWRYALTINFCRPYMRSRFDFPRLIKNKRIKLNPSSKSFLGFNVRVPVNLKQFYLPKSKRLYLPNQE